MIDHIPREGYGYGIIRMSRELTLHVAPLARISATDTQGYLKDHGAFDEAKKGLYLPDDYTIHGIFLEPPRYTWCVLVEAPGIPISDEGAMLPVLTPIYEMIWDFEKGAYQARLKRIDISSDPHHVLRVD